MRMKRVLLATTALAMVAGASQAQAGDLYLSVFGGGNFLADSSFASTGGECDGGETCSFSSDADTGFVLGGAIGTSLDKWAKGLRVEMEVSYRRNDVGGTWTASDENTEGLIDGNMSTFAIMANTWYDVDVGHKVVPYVGGGVGWARMHGDVQFFETPGCCEEFTNTASNSGFAWQLGLGINYEVMPAVDLGLGYRYFVGPRFDNFFSGKNSDPRLENHNHAVMVNLTIGIDAQ